jgi:hypothetical protein
LRVALCRRGKEVLCQLQKRTMQHSNQSKNKTNTHCEKSKITSSILRIVFSKQNSSHHLVKCCQNLLIDLIKNLLRLQICR